MLKNKHLLTGALRSIAKHYVVAGRMHQARQHRLRVAPQSPPLDEEGNLLGKPPKQQKSKGLKVQPPPIPDIPPASLPPQAQQESQQPSQEDESPDPEED